MSTVVPECPDSSTATCWRDAAAQRFQQSIDTPTRFFEASADCLSHACFAMAKRFAHGGRLLVFGTGRSATDAQHVSVEFVHPVIVGKRALPAIALTNDIASVLGLAQQAGIDEIFARRVRMLGRPDDIALGLSVSGDDPAVERGLAAAHGLGLLTIGMFGAGVEDRLDLDHCMVVHAGDPNVVQEVQETAYHILWETVHVFFEHQGLL